MLRRDYESWGKYFHFDHYVKFPAWTSEVLQAIQDTKGSVLPYGKGRSYGDSCLNHGETLIDTKMLNRFISFNKETGVLRCEAGVTLEQILNLILPYGWFLPVSPGTKFVTIAGAIANDVHGKNHHVKGTIGRHISWMSLLTSDGKIHYLTPEMELFQATVAGMGLTGFILEAEIRLIKEIGWFDTENIKFGGLDEFFQISDESDQKFEYSMAWVDCISSGKNLGRGIFMRGNHSLDNSLPLKPVGQKLIVPFNFPEFALSQPTITIFNHLYFHKQVSKILKDTVHYEPFFYPLDMIHDWNKIYGRRGFFQYQFVVPYNEKLALRDIFSRIARSGMGSFLAVFKKFGNVPSPGLLSFPEPGYTLALDFANAGSKTEKLFSSLDRIIEEAGGRLYPAKDSKMSANQFMSYYPKFEQFKKWIDPKFSSSFLRRVTTYD